MTQFACSFIGQLGLCDSKVGAFPIPGLTPSTLHPQEALLTAGSRHPSVRDQVDAAQFQSMLQIKSLRATKPTPLTPSIGAELLISICLSLQARLGRARASASGFVKKEGPVTEAAQF